MKSFSSFVIALACLSLVSCQKKSATGSTSTAGGTAMKSVNDTLSAVSKLAPGALTRRGDRSNVTDWTTSQLPDPRNSGEASCTFTSSISPKRYMQIDFTESATRCNGSDVNVFGRLHTAMQIGCFMLNMFDAATSDALPTTGTQTVIIDSAAATTIAANCHATVPSEIQAIPLQVTFDVPGDTTTFDRKMTLALPGRAETFTTFVRYNSAAVAISGSESNERGASRSLVQLNRSTNVLRAEYVSKGVASATETGALYVHRLYYDQTSDVGRVVSSIRVDSIPAATMRRTKYVVSGKPSTTGIDMAMGLDFIGWGGTYDATPYNLSACVDKSTGDLRSPLPTVSSNAFTCTSGSTAVAGIAPGGFTADSTIWSTINAHPTDWFNRNLPAFSWTGLTDIYTADF